MKNMTGPFSLNVAGARDASRREPLKHMNMFKRYPDN